MARVGHNYNNAAALLLILTISALLTACANPLESLNCHYQPVRGTVVVLAVTEDRLDLSFKPDAVQDTIWFKRFGLNPEELEMPKPPAYRKPQVDSRYTAILNLRTSGRCAPYIIYLGDKVSP